MPDQQLITDKKQLATGNRQPTQPTNDNQHNRQNDTADDRHSLQPTTDNRQPTTVSLSTSSLIYIHRREHHKYREQRCCSIKWYLSEESLIASWVPFNKPPFTMSIITCAINFCNRCAEFFYDIFRYFGTLASTSMISKMVSAYPINAPEFNHLTIRG